MMPNIARHPQPSNEMNQKIDHMVATGSYVARSVHMPVTCMDMVDLSINSMLVDTLEINRSNMLQVSDLGGPPLD